MRQASRRAARGSAAFAASLLALVLAGCGPTTPPPKVENIVVPLPANVEAVPPPPLPAVETEPTPPELVTASKGEDLWHLRSALNVAALICKHESYSALIPGYNRLLLTHKALLTAAVQSELDQFKLVDKKKWQALYDSHMTKLYNQYSITPRRDKFCEKASQIAGHAADLSDEALTKEATTMIFRLNLAGEINQVILVSAPSSSPTQVLAPMP